MRLNEIWQFDQAVEGHKYGLEFEVAGTNLPRTRTQDWSWKTDGSVPRGLEYVSNEPFAITALNEQLTELKVLFDESRSKIVPETACSTHVHMNVQDLEVRSIVAIMVTYYLLEDLLVEYCGPDRVGNLFCLRLSDSSAPVDAVVRGINTRRFPANIRGDSLRYAAMNITSMATFGTLEFRSMGGITRSPLEVKDWVLMLHRIKMYGIRHATPEAVMEAFSRRGPRVFVEQVLGERLAAMVYTDPVEHDECMYQAASAAQWLAYDIKWDRVGRQKLPQRDEPQRVMRARPDEGWMLAFEGDLRR